MGSVINQVFSLAYQILSLEISLFEYTLTLMQLLIFGFLFTLLLSIFFRAMR